MKLLPRAAFGKRKPLTGLLGLAFDGNKLHGVVLRRQNGSLRPGPTFSAALTLDPLTNDAELVGREILNHLEAAGVRERRCAVAVPLKWALTAHTTIPAMPDADVESFLKIEAERGFPCDAASLRVATSRYVSPLGARHATFIGISAAHLARLEQALRAAKLKPVSFSLATTALQPPSRSSDDGVLALVIGENQIALQITCGGGVAALRALDGVIESNAVNAELLLREIRITLGQLPAGCRAAIKRVRIFGAPEPAQALAGEISSRFQSLEMNVAVVSSYGKDEFGPDFPPASAVSAAFSVAARRLADGDGAYEFLPPKVPAWKQFGAKYASGKLRTAGLAAAALILLVAGAFGVQQWELFRLDAQWDRMKTTVGELQDVQQQIRAFRPWFDDSFRGLTILRELTLAFPEDGSVTAKTFEFRDQNTVSCSGTATDSAALLRTLGQLRAADGVHDVKVDQMRGKAPLQFTFRFQYGTAETGDEN